QVWSCQAEKKKREREREGEGEGEGERETHDSWTCKVPSEKNKEHGAVLRNHSLQMCRDNKETYTHTHTHTHTHYPTPPPLPPPHGTTERWEFWNAARLCRSSSAVCFVWNFGRSDAVTVGS